MERVAVMCRSDIVTASDLGFLATAVSDEADGSGDGARSFCLPWKISSAA